MQSCACSQHGCAPRCALGVAAAFGDRSDVSVTPVVLTTGSAARFSCRRSSAPLLSSRRKQPQLGSKSPHDAPRCVRGARAHRHVGRRPAALQHTLRC